MSITAGIDVGSTYTKAVILKDDAIIGKAMSATGFKLTEVSESLVRRCAGRRRNQPRRRRLHHRHRLRQAPVQVSRTWP